MKRKTLKREFSTISWVGDFIADWSQSLFIHPADEEKEEGDILSVFSFGFDAAISTPGGEYTFLYKRLGTKGLLLKNREELREINRPYYLADRYEYPAAFFQAANGRTYLVHCPLQYDRLEFEDVETGELVTNIPERERVDCFHSRLKVTADNRYLLNAGWHWHPWGIAYIYDLNACLENPNLLDGQINPEGLRAEVCSATFVDEQTVLMGTSSEEESDDENPGPVLRSSLALWELTSGSITKSVKVKGEFGAVYPIDHNYCWDTYKYPKIINLNTGEVEDKVEDIFSGLNNYPLISDAKDFLPKIAFNSTTKQLAIALDTTIEILTPDIGSM